MSHSLLHEFFSVDGPLSKIMDSYQVREDQVHMAEFIHDAFQSDSPTIIEAGTGTGKTFAYLAPILMHGGKAIISTATKNLQDQLFLKDIPKIRDALKIPLEVSVLKGRNNYLCQLRMENVASEGLFLNRDDISHVEKIKHFSKHSVTGEISEIDDIPESSTVWPLVTSTSDNCLGQSCTHAKECFFLKARKKALSAEIIVVNHHLLFADLSLKDEDISEILPKVDTIFFDEAHQVPEIASFFFGNNFSSNQLIVYLQELNLSYAKYNLEDKTFFNLTETIISSLSGLRSLLPSVGHRVLLDNIENKQAFIEDLKIVHEHLNQLKDFLIQYNDESPEHKKNLERIDNYLNQILLWLEEKDEKFVYWLDLYAKSIQFNITPLSVAEPFKKIREDHQLNWLFTSATLTVDNSFEHFKENLGLNDAREKSYPSPFDYQKNAMLYVPEGMPEPNDSNFNIYLVNKMLPLIEACHGRTFILSTSLKGVAEISTLLKDEFLKRNLDISVLSQGNESKNVLLKRFRELPSAVLVGSMSFWEGIDIRGQKLSLVIIDKLPFQSPGDPIFESKINHFNARGLNAFFNLQLPHAVIQLKQGSGRLIRDHNDQGVLAITDPRIINRGYGKKFWKSLPNYKRSRDQDEAIAFLKSL
ncbi:MAG: ATP-dependent DNA helicase [Methylophilaceae bacterium]